MTKPDMSAGERNVNMICEISLWVAGYLTGSDPAMCMEHITKAMQREGYVPEMKRKKIK